MEQKLSRKQTNKNTKKKYETNKRKIDKQNIRLINDYQIKKRKYIKQKIDQILSKNIKKKHSINQIISKKNLE